MPLVKGGKITPDTFAHVADDAELPAQPGILVSAARFLADPEGLLGRPGGKCGRDLAEQPRHR